MVYNTQIWLNIHITQIQLNVYVGWMMDSNQDRDGVLQRKLSEFALRWWAEFYFISYYFRFSTGGYSNAGWYCSNALEPQHHWVSSIQLWNEMNWNGGKKKNNNNRRYCEWVKEEKNIVIARIKNWLCIVLCCTRDRMTTFEKNAFARFWESPENISENRAPIVLYKNSSARLIPPRGIQQNLSWFKCTSIFMKTCVYFPCYSQT